MANIRKSFNFKNGVQVDNDKFVVNANGLVGIGTTIPRQLLDVRGTTQVTGFLTATQMQAENSFVTGIATATTLTDGTVQISSGIITAVTGVVTFYGDGAGLINIPSSQWLDIDIGLGYTSIYAQGNVGVGTDDPRFSFQVGGQPGVTGHEGVGISSITGDIISTGIISATTLTGAFDAPQLTGTINNARLPDDISVQSVTAGVGFTGNLTGIAQSASSLVDTPDINVGRIDATDLHLTEVNTTRLDVSGVGTVSTLTVSNTVDVTTSVKVGTSGTAFTALDTGKIGIGTMMPGEDLTVHKPSGATIEVVSDTGEAKVSIGQSVDQGVESAVIRYGNQADTLDILNNSTGDIRMVLDSGTVGVNTGNFSWHYNTPATTLMNLTYQGNLGINNLTPSEKLAVGGGITVTDNSFLQGNITSQGTITANTFVGSVTLPDPAPINISPLAGITTLRELHLFSTISNIGVSSIGINTNDPVAGLDARTTTGFFKRVAVGGTNTFSGLGTSFPLQQGANPGEIAFEVVGLSKFTSIGIGTTVRYIGGGNQSIQIFDGGIGLYNGGDFRLYDGTTTQGIPQIAAIGFNTDLARSTLDMGVVAIGNTTPALILPSITEAKRDMMVDPVGAAGTVPGSIIFNTSTNNFQGYNGTAWVNLG